MWGQGGSKEMKGTAEGNGVNIIKVHMQETVQKKEEAYGSVVILSFHIPQK